MFGFVGRVASPPVRSPAQRRQRLTRLLYRGSMAVAAGIALLVLAAAMFPRPQYEPGLVGLWLQLASDAALKKMLVVAAVCLWLTAVVFFRPDFADAEADVHELVH